MKKFYAFVAAALMSVSMFADPVAPTATDLAQMFDLASNVVLCFQPIEDATVCRDIYFVGSPNNWGKGEGTTEAFENCEKFVELAGFPGWYAAELPYSDGFYGKPLHSTEDGAWSWDFQCGDPDSWVFVDGNQITINKENDNESSMGYPSAGAYIYQLKYWKAHRNPCVAVVKHYYTITLYAPDACPEMKPGIAGDDMGWTAIAMTEDMDDDFNTIYTYSFEGQEGHGYKIIDATLGWDNEMQYYSDSEDKWVNFQNIELTADSNIVLDWSDNAKYRFTKCDNEEPVAVEMNVKLPALNCPASVEVIGDFDGWKGTAMAFENTGYFYAFFDAKPSQFFKFRSGDGATDEEKWAVELEIYDETKEDWFKIQNGDLTFDDLWEEGLCYGDPCQTVTLDFSDATKYRWTTATQGIENVVLTEKAHKVVVDGVLYIIRDNKLFNIQGTQVR